MGAVLEGGWVGVPRGVGCRVIKDVRGWCPWGGRDSE